MNQAIENKRERGLFIFLDADVHLNFKLLCARQGISMSEKLRPMIEHEIMKELKKEEKAKLTRP